MQDELPPQSEMRMGGKRGFQPYMPVATMIAASMQPPPSVEVCGLSPHLLCSMSHNRFNQEQKFWSKNLV